ncbi:MAG: hypothetical protein HC824_01745 [Synechococcales cyanobacterium RM1_1_8]|nr:hypothetical protein [Synechococcales cyanobacterium RM1_1_8]
MKTMMLKFSTTAISLLAIALGVHLQATDPTEPVLAFNILPAALRPIPLEQAIPFDTLLIPGQSVGPVTANTSYGDLAQLFEPARLVDGEASLGEGITQPSTTVDLGKRQSFTVVWADARRQQIVEVRELGPDWHTPEGIHVGLSLKELERILGPFQIYGFAWDHGGTVLLDERRLAHYRDKLFIQLQPSQTQVRRNPQAFQSVLGDELFPSSHSSLEQLNPVVDQMVVRLEPAQAKAQTKAQAQTPIRPN